ncbi:MAG: phospholipase D-like domain-containing protein [Crocinitomicaceae bacterium]
MAKFITTKRISAELEDLIKNTSERLYLVSYNFKISDEYLEHLEDVIDRGVKVYIAYGVQIDKRTMEKLKCMPNLQIKKKENLHAKIYLNGSTCIVGSMNFSEASERNRNIECGVIFSKNEDEQMFNEAFEEVVRIFKRSEMERPLLPKEIHDKAKTKVERKTSGYCIRCEKKIPYNIDKPFCKDCFYEWEEWENANYKENVCHSCGKDVETSMAKPVCYDCYKKFEK